MHFTLKVVLSVLFAVVSANAAIVEEPIVDVEQGSVRGNSHLKTAEGRTIYSFEGIPYAKPPVGKHRFKEPQPAQPWHGVWDGRQQGSVCLQYDHMVYLSPLSIVGDEDCLFVNIYTPKLPTAKSKPLDVIVYIHGGGFTSGSGNLYMPRYLLDKEIVFATLNYRLGPLGFLSTEDEVVPGNNGLKDQQYALAWIQRNIKAFGGNPDSITISGMSAGGASVQYHYFSPKSANLFHKGISMSGSTLCPFPQVENSREKANRIGATLGCPTKSSYELIECLKDRPARRIVRLVKELFMPWHYNPYSPFGPTVEKAGPNPFIRENPIDLLLKGQVQQKPWIASVTTEEGLYPTSNFVADADILKELDDRWLELAPHVLDFNFTIPVNLQKEAAKKIKKEYLGNKPISRETNRQFTHMVGDRLYVVDVERAARLQSAVSSAPVYFYRFSYRGKHSYSKLMSGGSLEDFGVSHGDDTMYVLSVFYGNPEETAEDRAMTQRMLDFWTSFAKTGVPKSNGVTWNPVKPNQEKVDYLEIESSSSIHMASSEDLGRRKFWETLNFKEPSYTANKSGRIRDEI